MRQIKTHLSPPTKSRIAIRRHEFKKKTYAIRIHYAFVKVAHAKDNYAPVVSLVEVFEENEVRQGLSETHRQFSA